MFQVFRHTSSSKDTMELFHALSLKLVFLRSPGFALSNTKKTNQLCSDKKKKNLISQKHLSKNSINDVEVAFSIIPHILNMLLCFWVKKLKREFPVENVPLVIFTDFLRLVLLRNISLFFFIFIHCLSADLQNKSVFIYLFNP